MKAAMIKQTAPTIISTTPSFLRYFPHWFGVSNEVIKGKNIS